MRSPEFYRVSKEDKAKADLVFVEAAKKQMRQVVYEPRWVAITNYYHTVLKKKMTKEKAKLERPPLTKQQYMQVIPSWANGMRDAWGALVDRWTGDNAEFIAISRKNKANRGSEGTHAQGNRSHQRHKKNLELVMKQPLSDVQSYKLGRVRKTPKEGKGLYYGATEEHLKSYEDEFHRWNGEERDPMLSETDEMTVVLSGHGKPHVRYMILNNVIQPTIKLTELRSYNTRESVANPSRAWPRRSKEEAYHSYLHSFQGELDAYNTKVQERDEYRATQLENLYEAMQNKTQAPPMGPPPPNPGRRPHMLSIEQFLARYTQTPGSHGSNSSAGGGSCTPTGATPSSQSSITPINNPGGGASTSTPNSPIL